jgi:hypothetical protein
LRQHFTRGFFAQTQLLILEFSVYSSLAHENRRKGALKMSVKLTHGQLDEVQTQILFTTRVSLIKIPLCKPANKAEHKDAF